MAYSEKLSSALSRILTAHSFWATILMQQCELIESDEFPGVGPIDTAATDGRRIVISPQLVAQSTPREIMFVLAHEVAHVMFMHPYRGKQWAQRGHGPDGKPFNREKWQYAIDYVVNALLASANIGDQYAWVLRHDRVTGSESVEDVYCMLPDDFNRNGGKCDVHIDPDGDFTEEKAMAMQDTVRQAVANARAMGEDPGTVANVALRSFESTVSWQDVIRGEISRRPQAMFDDWKRINRRRIAQGAPFVSPGRCGMSAGELVIVLDTSGSCIEEVGGFISEIRKIYEDTPPDLTHILWVDSEVAHVDIIEDVFQFEEVVERVIEKGIPGGGGTHMPAAFNWALENGVFPSQMIIFTDGYTDYGVAQGYPVIWAITDERRVDGPPFGTKVHVKL